MKKLAVGALVLSGFLGGCHSDDSPYYTAPKALDKMSHEELCAFYAKYISNPDLSQQAKMVATEQRRSKGCT